MTKIEEKHVYRMYCINLRHLSGINKAVQANHASVLYTWKFKNEPYMEQYVNIDKTTIMVDGGTHQDMVEIQRQFEEAGIHHTYFIEPDLNFCMTAITVVADERVWDKCYSRQNFVFDGEEPEDTEELYNYWVEYIGGEQNRILSEILNSKKLSL